MKKLLSWIAIGLITFYRGAISPHFPPSCRFTPTCSEYALQAFRKYPPYRALWLTLRRLSRCHPWGVAATTLSPDHRVRNRRKRENG